MIGGISGFIVFLSTCILDRYVYQTHSIRKILASWKSNTCLLNGTNIIPSFLIQCIRNFMFYILNSKPSLDDPCCTFITHGICGIWGMLAVGIFAKVISSFLIDLSRYLCQGFDISTTTLGRRHFAWVQLQQAPWNYLWWRLLAWGSGLCIFSF